jgi:hypothetical protein
VPQLLGSLAVSVQVFEPAQITWPAIGHAHTPVVHDAVAGHTCPHVPQLSASVCRPVVQPLTPPAVHIVVPVGHEHAPAVHTPPDPQFVHAAPQCRASVCVS